jgi:hypothetical protein
MEVFKRYLGLQARTKKTFKKWVKRLEVCARREEAIARANLDEKKAKNHFS